MAFYRLPRLRGSLYLSVCCASCAILPFSLNCILQVFSPCAELLTNRAMEYICILNVPLHGGGETIIYTTTEDSPDRDCPLCQLYLT